jgi:formylmethanofuran dehydrogenase subunit C
VTIAAVASQAGGAGNTSGSASQAFTFSGNVTAGSLIVFGAHRYNVSTDSPFTAGNLTKTAGTSTIGTITLDQSNTILDGSQYQQGIWSCIVTGTGSLTLTCAGGVSGAFWMVAADEYTGSFDTNRVEAINLGETATNGVTPAVSGNGTSAGAGLFWGLLGIDGSSTITITPEAAFTQVYEQQSASTHLTGAAERQITGGATTDQAEWTLSGTWTMYTALLVVYREVTATNDISAAGTLSITGAADLDATGTIAAAGALSITGAADLDARGVLLAAGALSITGAADLDAVGQLLASGALSIVGAADLDALGTLAAAGTLSITGDASLTSGAEKDIAAAGALSIVGSAALNATGTLTASGAVSITGSADLTSIAAGDMAAAGLLTIIGDATLTAPGSLAAAGSLSITGDATLTPLEAISAKIGGDDIPYRKSPHRGHDKERARLKITEEQRLAADIRAIYRELTDAPETRDRAEEAVSGMRLADERSGDSGISADSRDIRAALDRISADSETALRMLRLELADLLAADDERAIYEMLSQLL